MIKTTKSLSLSKLAPSMVTLFSLCISLYAIRFSFEGKFLHAVSFILLAGFLDGVDGRIARFLNATSKFGAELDSLVDFVNFGIVPGFLIYNWINKFGDIKGFDWALVMIFAISMAIRLARFNVDLEDKEKNPILEKYFFKGIPAPVAAAMLTLPLVLTFGFGEGHFFNDPKIIISYSFCVAIFAASTVPTISLKRIPIRNEYVYLTILILGLIIVGLLVTPWLTLSIICLVYVLSIFCTIIAYFRIKNNKTFLF